MGVKKGLSIDKKANKSKVEESSKRVKSNEIKATEKKPVSKKTSPAKTHIKPKENLKKSQEPSQVIDNKVKEIDKTIKSDKKEIKQPKNDLKKLDSKEVEPLSAPKTRKKKEVVVKVPMTKQQIIAKGMEARKTFTLTEDRYDEIKSYLTSRGDEYDVVISGTTEKIRLANKTYVPFNAENMIGSGYHLANMVKADVKQWLENSVRVDENAEINYFGERYGDDWLEKNKSILVRRGRDYSEQGFNLDAIEKNVGKVLVSIDINDCYWQTAFNRGWITEKTYVGGLRKKEWKVGRNASIGSLCKVEMITTYKHGVIARDSMGKIRRKITRKEAGYQYIRHNIIGFVCDMFIELANILGDDFFMYLTDCVFTTMERKKEVEEFFKKYGYTCKAKTFEFTNIYRDDRVVEWVELREPDTPKYYRYALGQVYNPNQMNVKLEGK